MNFLAYGFAVGPSPPFFPLRPKKESSFLLLFLSPNPDSSVGRCPRCGNPHLFCPAKAAYEVCLLEGLALQLSCFSLRLPRNCAALTDLLKFPFPGHLWLRAEKSRTFSLRSVQFFPRFFGVLADTSNWGPPPCRFPPAPQLHQAQLRLLPS